MNDADNIKDTAAEVAAEAVKVARDVAKTAVDTATKVAETSQKTSEAVASMGRDINYLTKTVEKIEKTIADAIPEIGKVKGQTNAIMLAAGVAVFLVTIILGIGGYVYTSGQASQGATNLQLQREITNLQTTK